MKQLIDAIFYDLINIWELDDSKAFTFNNKDSANIFYNSLLEKGIKGIIKMNSIDPINMPSTQYLVIIKM